MKCGLLLFLLSLSVGSAAADYFYAGVGIGKNAMLFSEQQWEDHGEMGTGFRIGYRHHIGGQWYGDFNFAHHSQITVGRPFNDEEGETTSDHLYYYLEYHWE